MWQLEDSFRRFQHGLKTSQFAKEHTDLPREQLFCILLTDESQTVLLCLYKFAIWLPNTELKAQSQEILLHTNYCEYIERRSEVMMAYAEKVMGASTRHWP